MNKKMIISIIILILGIGLVVSAVFLPKEKLEEEKQESGPLGHDEEKNRPIFDKNVGVIPEDDPDNDRVLIFDFKYEEVIDGVKINFEIYNGGDHKIENKVIYVNFYNGDDLISTYESNIESLEPGKSIIKEEEARFVYDKITDYQLIYNNYRLETFNKEDYIKKNGELGSKKVETNESENEESDE